MSYDESQPPARRRFRRSTLILLTAVLVAAALAGWLVRRGPGGQDGSGPPAALSASGVPSAAADRTPPARSGSAAPPPATDDGKGHGNTKTSGGARSTGPLAGTVVVIDPGHNPHNYQHTKEINKQVSIGRTSKECDTTGTSTNAGYAEALFTLDVSHRLRALLEKEGAKVTLTYDNDRPYGPCVDERARIGNQAGADAAVSVHADGSAAGNRGFHVILPALVKSGGADTSKIVAPSRDLGERVAGMFVRDTGSAPSNYIGGGTGLDVRKDLGGLNLSTVPKVLIECGNMRDPKDAALLTSAAWRQKAAQGLADGISGFLEN